MSPANMVSIEARAAAGFHKYDSLYDREWEKVADGDGVPVRLSVEDATACIAYLQSLDRADGRGEHTYYRIA